MNIRSISACALAILLSGPLTSSFASPVVESETIVVDIGGTARSIHDMRYDHRYLDFFGTAGNLHLSGVEGGLTFRVSDFAVAELRGDYLWSPTASSASGRMGVSFDPQWAASPYVGGWVGARHTDADWTEHVPDLNLFGPPGPEYDYAGTTTGRDVLLGVDAGLRLRTGHFIATLGVNWGVALTSERQTVVTSEDQPDEAPEALSVGETGELGLSARVGFRW